MLKKLGAALLAVGLVLPYGCDTRPITGVWSDLGMVLFYGVPVLITVAYVLHTFVPPLTRLHERNGRALHGVLRVVYFMLAGAYLGAALTEEGTAEWVDGVFLLAALLLSRGLLYWEQQRGTKAERVPLLLLVIVGIPAVNSLSLIHTRDLKIGAWVFTAGYALAVAAEIRGLMAAPKISHSG